MHYIYPQHFSGCLKSFWVHLYLQNLPAYSRVESNKHSTQKHNTLTLSWLEPRSFVHYQLDHHAHLRSKQYIFFDVHCSICVFSLRNMTFFPVESCNNSMYDSGTTPNCSISFEEMLTHSIPRPPWHGYVCKLYINNCNILNVLFLSW